ncbi:hypothetical protein HX035_24175 [Escherichia coli]|nr:hypothetical protein [Escherichia coli]
MADALSWKVSLLAIFVISSPLVDEVNGKINQDSFFAPIITLLLKESKNPRELRTVQGYKRENDCLYFNDRLCTPREDDIKRRLLIEAHDSPIAGHLGYIKTYMSRRAYFGQV